MPEQTVALERQPTNEQIQAALNQIQSRAEGRNFPGPYPDARELAALMGNALLGGASLTTGTVTADADGGANGVEVLLPYTPRVVFLFNQTQVWFYVKLPTMAGLFATKLTGAGPVFSFADNRIRLSNAANDDTKAFFVHDGEVAPADVLHWAAIA